MIGLLVGGVLTYVVLLKYGMEWPKWLRFGLVIAGGGTLAYVGSAHETDKIAR